MDIFNRPPSIAEDNLTYTIYPPKSTPAAVLCALVSSHVHDELLPSNHIWHRDSFQLRVIDNKRDTMQAGQDEGLSRIEGTMRVGDCVDDEWCVVWILFQISKKWDVAIR